MKIEDLLQAMLAQPASGGSASQPAASGGDPLVDILGGLLGGGAAGGARAGTRPSASSGDPLVDILGGLLGGGAAGGARAGTRPSASSGDPLVDILGGLLGGGTAGGASAGTRPSASSGDPLVDILGGLLGGGAAGGASAGSTGGLGSVVQMLIQALGGRREFSGIVEGLAAKLGLPPAIAQAVVGFVLEKLLTAPAKTASTARKGQAAAKPATTSRTRKTQRPGSAPLREMFEQGAQIEQKHIQKSGLATELAQRTGMEPAMAAQSLEYVFGALQGHANQLNAQSSQFAAHSSRIETTEALGEGHQRHLPRQ